MAVQTTDWSRWPCSRPELTSEIRLAAPSSDAAGLFACLERCHPSAACPPATRRMHSSLRTERPPAVLEQRPCGCATRAYERNRRCCPPRCPQPPKQQWARTSITTLSVSISPGIVSHPGSHGDRQRYCVALALACSRVAGKCPPTAVAKATRRDLRRTARRL